MHYRQLSANEYTKITQSYPKKHFPIEQAPIWGAFQDTIPGRTYMGTFLLHNNEQPIATTTLIKLHMRGYSYVWANQGPIFLTTPTQKICDEASQCLKRICRNHARPTAKSHMLFVRAHLPHQPAGGSEAYSYSLIETTTVVNLRQPYETILAGMNYGARRGMRKASKAGIVIREVPTIATTADFAPFYSILQETAARDGYFIHPTTTYQSMLRELGQHVRFFAAYSPANKPIAWAIITLYQGYAEYYYGASNQLARETMAPYLLHVEVMKTLQAEGAHAYDFLGIGSKKFPGLEGVTQFKLRFGGEVVHYTPVYDVSLSPLYRPWTWAQAAHRKLQRH